MATFFILLVSIPVWLPLGIGLLGAAMSMWSDFLRIFLGRGE